MTGYLLSASVATPILGRIGDKVGKERLLSELLDRARQSGDVRAELTVMDAYACVLGLRSVIDDTAGRDADIWRRYLAIVLAGFRPAADPLAHPVVGDTLLIHADRSADRPERSR